MKRQLRSIEQIEKKTKMDKAYMIDKMGFESLTGPSIVSKKDNVVHTRVPIIYKHIINGSQLDRSDFIAMARAHASVFAVVTLGGPFETMIRTNPLTNEIFQAALKEIGCSDYADTETIISKALNHRGLPDEEKQVVLFVQTRYFIERGNRTPFFVGPFKEFIMLSTRTDFYLGDLCVPESESDILLVLMARKQVDNKVMKGILDKCVLGEDDVVWIIEFVMQLTNTENIEMIEWIKSKKNLKLIMTLATNKRPEDFRLAEPW